MSPTGKELREAIKLVETSSMSFPSSRWLLVPGCGHLLSKVREESDDNRGCEGCKRIRDDLSREER